MKTRTTTELVSHTVDGKTRMVPIKVDAPAPPRDWDHLVLNAVTGIAAVVLTASVVWSTASIGDLLARAVIEPAAYGAAIVFDLAWIACMAVEWLARYDEDRAALPRKAGNLFLILAMVAIGAHGKLTGYWEIGIVGALVSAVAKGLWTVVLRHQTPPLDERTRAWIHAELAEAGASLALVPVRRRVQRAHGLVAAERAAITRRADHGSADVQEVGQEFALIQAPRPSKELRGAAGTPVEDLSSLRGVHGPIVYFLGNGGRVKIGTTRSLTGRLSDLCLRFDNLLCAFHGGHDIESRFHKMFAAHRVGDSEWFEIDGALAEFIASQTGDAAGDAASASGDAPDDADDADGGASQGREVPPPLPPLPTGGSKSSLILAASSMLRRDAPAAEIAHLLAQHGHAVDTAYIRTVLSRRKQEDDGVGKGGGGYA